MLLLLAAVIAGRAAPQESPREPLEARLAQEWRWRLIDGPDGTATVFRLVRPGRGDGLLAHDNFGLVAYDGWAWQRQPGWRELPDEVVRDMAPLEDGVLLVTDARICTVDAAGGWTDLDTYTDPGDMSLICRRDDGSLDVAVRGIVKRASLVDLRHVLDKPDGVQAVMALVQDAAGNLWCASEKGMHRQVGDEWILLSAGARRTDQWPRYVQAASTNQHVFFLPDTINDIQPGMDFDGREPRQLRHAGGPLTVTDAATTSDGELIVASGSSVLSVWRDGAWQAVQVPLPSRESVISLCITESGRLAAVFSSGRMAICDLASNEWEQFDTHAAKVGGSVNAIAPSQRGGLWLALDEGLARFADGRFVETYKEVKELNVDLFKVTTVCEDATGDVWIGSGSAFAGALRLHDGRWTRYMGRNDVGDTYVHAIRRIGDELWFLMIGGLAELWTKGGAVRLKDGEFQGFTRDPDGTLLPRTYDILERRDGSLLAGMTKSVRTFDGGTWRNDPTAPLDNRSAFALYETGDGTLWVGFGLRAAGVAVLHEGVWQRLDSGPWQRAAAASFAATPDGRLWFASEKGLFHVIDNKCREVSGRLPLHRFWPLLSDGAGGLWLGSLGAGLLHFRPSDMEAPKLSGPIEVRYTEAGEVVARWNAVDLWNATPPEELSFRVLLDGLPVESAPAPAGGHQVIRGDLAPGPHELVVTAIDSLGNTAEAPVRHPFTVPPPWWRSAPVLLAAGATTLVLLWLLIVIRNRRRERALATASQHELSERLSALTLRLLSSQEDERRNISREMHDDLGQLLTAACLDIERAARLEDIERRREALRSALRAARDTQRRVREISHMLRPTELDDHGLSQAVTTVLSDFTTRSGIDVESRVDLDGRPLPADVANHVFRILQEALTNILRHARAGTAFVTLQATARHVDLRVRDDGVGFDPLAVPPTRGFGLLGMRERAELLGGKFSIRSQPAGGTEVSVSIPIPHR